MSPQAKYRDRFFRRILEKSPTTVLDVGCGNGQLMEKLVQHGVQVAGLEPDEALAQACNAKGFATSCAASENMPFKDNAFDMVVSEFSLHHFANGGSGIAECLRVASHCVLFLDCWYDLTIPSQRSADAFDRWMKEIDRLSGEIHYPALSAGEVLAYAQKAVPKLDVEAEHWLDLVPLKKDKFQRLVDESLAKACLSGDAEASLSAIKRQIEQDGLSEDGALFVSLTLPPAASP